MRKVNRVSGYLEKERTPLDITDIDLATYLVYEGIEFSPKIDKKGITHYIFNEVPEIILEQYPFSDVHRVLALYHSIYKLAKVNRSRT